MCLPQGPKREGLRGNGATRGPPVPPPPPSRSAGVWRRAPLPSQRRPAAVTPAPPPSDWLTLLWYEGPSANRCPAGPPSDVLSELIGGGAGQRRPRLTPVNHRAGKGGPGGNARYRRGISGGPMELLRKWLGHPEDIYHLLRFKMGGYRAVMPRMDPVSGTGCDAGAGGRECASLSPSIGWCPRGWRWCGGREEEEEEEEGAVISLRGCGVAVGERSTAGAPARCYPWARLGGIRTVSVLPGRCTGSASTAPAPGIAPAVGFRCAGADQPLPRVARGRYPACIAPAPSDGRARCFASAAGFPRIAQVLDTGPSASRT